MSASEVVRERERKDATEERRATVLTEIRLLEMDVAGGNYPVNVVDVNIGGRNSRPVKDVIVKSTTGLGGRAYAARGQSIIIRRNQGGRWVAIGPADRVRLTGTVQFLDEDIDGAAGETTGNGVGFTTRRAPYSYYKGDLPGTPGSGRYGNKGYPKSLVLDSEGNEVV